MIKDTFSHYRNEKLKSFVESLSADEQVVAHRTIQFIRTEFPECENAIRGTLIHQEKSWG
jgi:hypothetical protein